MPRMVRFLYGRDNNAATQRSVPNMSASPEALVVAYPLSWTCFHTTAGAITIRGAARDFGPHDKIVDGGP